MHITTRCRILRTEDRLTEREQRYASFKFHPEYGPPKHWYPTTTLHGVTTQKIATWLELNIYLRNSLTEQVSVSVSKRERERAPPRRIFLPHSICPCISGALRAPFGWVAPHRGIRAFCNWEGKGCSKIRWG
jgi:hypothetical protein